MLSYKIASEDWEFEAIHKLNYKTFVEEIPQHKENDQRKLIDKFHEHNTYIVAVNGHELLGMISINDQRPFSLDGKLSDIDHFLPEYSSICEFRLLAIEKRYRKSKIFVNLLKKILEAALLRGYDLGVISGTTRQTKLYQHIGFKPFAYPVGTKNALYQPMYISLDRIVHLKQQSSIFKGDRGIQKNSSMYNYLPGPVTMSPSVLSEYSTEPRSHREIEFFEKFKFLQIKLCEKVNAEAVHILMGSGTLANDIIAAQLSLLEGVGLVLINGEFGQRIEDHAKRAQLIYKKYYVEGSETFHRKELEETIQSEKFSWLWFCHCETSTGVLNHLSMIRELCTENSVRLVVDGISSIGSCHVDLNNVYLASAVSGKGIASLPGLALVFSKKQIVSGNKSLPRCFDLECYKQYDGIPYTISSNAIYAMIAALKSDWSKRFEDVRKWSMQIRSELESMGLKILASTDCRAPHITTIVLPKEIPSSLVGDELLEKGILVSYRSDYLMKDNLIQICFMGECIQPTPDLSRFLMEVIQGLHHFKMEEFGEKVSC